MQAVIEKASKQLDLPTKVIRDTYKAFGQGIKSIISDLPLQEDFTEEEFNNLKKSINIPYIGKLYCDYTNYKEINKHAGTRRNKTKI